MRRLSLVCLKHASNSWCFFIIIWEKFNVLPAALNATKAALRHILIKTLQLHSEQPLPPRGNSYCMQRTFLLLYVMWFFSPKYDNSALIKMCIINMSAQRVECLHVPSAHHKEVKKLVFFSSSHRSQNICLRPYCVTGWCFSSGCEVFLPPSNQKSTALSNFLFVYLFKIHTTYLDVYISRTARGKYVCKVKSVKFYYHSYIIFHAWLKKIKLLNMPWATLSKSNSSYLSAVHTEKTINCVTMNVKLETPGGNFCIYSFV